LESAVWRTRSWKRPTKRVRSRFTRPYFEGAAMGTRADAISINVGCAWAVDAAEKVSTW